MSGEKEGSITIEATFVFVVVFLFLESAFYLGFDVYKSSVKAINENVISDVDLVSRYRKYQFTKDVVERIKEKGGE